MSEFDSKIITKEVLDLHCVTEQEILTSNYKGLPWQDAASYIRFGVKLIRYDGQRDFGCRTSVVKTWEGFSLKQFVRWKQYFRYRQAIEQVKTPRQLVQVVFYGYVTADRNKVLLKALKNKLVAAKADVTKITNSIDRGVKLVSGTSLFGHEGDPKYMEALQKLENKKRLIAELEAEINNLSNHIKDNGKQI